MRFRIPLWAEIAIAILVALAISNVATILFFQIEAEGRWQQYGDELLADRIGDSANAILTAPEAKRAELLGAFSKRSERFTIDAAPIVNERAPRDTVAEQRIAAHLTGDDAKADIRVRSMPGFFTRRVNGGGFGFFRSGPDPRVTREGNVVYGTGPGRPASPDEPHLIGPGPLEPESGTFVESARGRAMGGPGLHPPDRMVVSIPLSPGRWLNARVGMPDPPSLPLVPMFSAAVAIAMLTLAAVWTARRVAVPLQRLSAAARAMRLGEPAPAVPETGPAAVRDATRSFNAMSQRLMATLETQRAMMVAIAHDLRTPIATLRLRAEFVGDEEAKARILDTLTEMQSMTEAVLDAARTSQTGEQSRQVDISALAESLVADMSEIGGDVAFTGDRAVHCMCRTGEIRRALRNIIENALRYGKRARVSVTANEETVTINVDDDGPGIPNEDMDRVFEPFARLEGSRSRETGGYGLGLSIARLIARSHGGDVKLKNRSDGGLKATLSLPVQG